MGQDGPTLSPLPLREGNPEGPAAPLGPEAERPIRVRIGLQKGAPFGRARLIATAEGDFGAKRTKRPSRPRLTPRPYRPSQKPTGPSEKGGYSPTRGGLEAP